MESFANTYYLKEPVKQATAQQLLQAGLDFTSQLTMIWVKSVAITDARASAWPRWPSTRRRRRPRPEPGDLDNVTPPEAAMNKSVVRSALLSARLFADARGHSQLRPEGPGVMDIKQALATLIEEGSSPAEQRLCPWITRLRIAGGLREALDPAHRGDRGGIAEPAYRGTPNAVSDQLEQVAKSDTAATLASGAPTSGASSSGLVDELVEAAKQHIPPAIARPRSPMHLGCDPTTAAPRPSTGRPRWPSFPVARPRSARTSR